jgi:AraC-like DNA-binding protein
MDLDYRLSIQRLLQGPLNRGLNPNHFLCPLKLSIDHLRHADTPINARPFIQLLGAIRDELQDEFFGLAVRRVKVGSYSTMVEYALAGRTLGTALDRAVRMLNLFSDDLYFECRQAGEELVVSIDAGDNSLDPEGFLFDYLLFSLHRTFSWLCGCLIPVRQVSTQFYDDKSRPDRMLSLLLDGVDFGAKKNAIILDAKFSDLPLIKSFSEWLDYVDAARQGNLDWPDDESSYRAKVLAILQHRLDGGQSILQFPAIANELALNPQTLRRYLQQEGFGYQQVLDDFRRARAIDYLLLQQLTVAEIASRLGFSEGRSFARAFKRWTSLSPSAYRLDSL